MEKNEICSRLNIFSISSITVTNFIYTLLKRHIEIMDHYDPEGKIDLIVDEWGCWHEVEPGTNPAFLYQQNTMRDAMVAAICLNAFNHYSRRVKMANLAQAVNVLQALILIEGDKMIKTPTYHVFDLYKEHQGGHAVYCYVENVQMRSEKNTPLLSSSASIKEGKLHITLANCSPNEEVMVEGQIGYFKGTKVRARILTQHMSAYNDFGHPEKVKVKAHQKINYSDGNLMIQLLPCSVISIMIE